MSTPTSIASLSAERDNAKAALNSSPAWVAWKSAMTALDHEPGAQSTPVPPPIDPTPEDVLQMTDGFERWDALDPLVSEYKRVQQLQQEKRRVNELRQHVEESEEWRTLIRLNRQLRAQLAEKINQLRRSLVVDKVDKPSMTTSGQALDTLPTTTSPQTAAPSPPQAEAPQPLPPEHPSENPTHGISNHSPATAPASRLATVTTSPSPVKRDEATKLMVPSWCSGVISDMYQPVPEQGLGLVDAELYQGMCGSSRNQVQRIWSATDAGHSLLGALLRALEFQVDTHIEPPPHARVEELRDSLLKTAVTWSDEEWTAYVPGYDSKAKEQFLSAAEAETTLLYLYHALHPTAPRIYVIVGNRSAKPQLSLLIISGKAQPKPNTRCVVLFQNVSTNPVPHVEVLSWKRGARGPSPLKTVMEFSDVIIQSLEAWFRQHQALPNATRKRGRDERVGDDMQPAKASKSRDE